MTFKKWIEQNRYVFGFRKENLFKSRLRRWRICWVDMIDSAENGSLVGMI